MLEVMGPTGAFGFYVSQSLTCRTSLQMAHHRFSTSQAGLNILALIMIIFWVPETKGLTLEEMDSVFEVPTKKFAAYQVKHAIPYFIKRYVFFNKSARLEPLVHLRGKEQSMHP
jgi:hypothetical protein